MIAWIAGVWATICWFVPSLTSFVSMGLNIEVLGMNSDTKGSDDSCMAPDEPGLNLDPKGSDDSCVAPDKPGLNSEAKGSDDSCVAPDKLRLS